MISGKMKIEGISAPPPHVLRQQGAVASQPHLQPATMASRALPTSMQARPALQPYQIAGSQVTHSQT